MLNINITGNTLKISEGDLVLYQVQAKKFIHHSKTFPKLIGLDGRDWGKEIREAGGSERSEFPLTYKSRGPNRTIDLFTTDDHVIVREGEIVLFQTFADEFEFFTNRPAFYEGWDPWLEAYEFILHKKGRYQYLEKHTGSKYSTETIRIDLDTGEQVNITELERWILSRKVPGSDGCYGCFVILIIFIIFLLIVQPWR